MERPLAGQRALVTGGGSGIGLASAAALVADGASVTLMGRTGEKLEAAAADLRAGAPEGVEVATFPGDVTVEADVVAAVAAAAGKDGVLHICVAAAGDGTVGPMAVMPAEEWHRVLGVSLTGVFFTIKAAAAQMMRAEVPGSIVAISSLAGSTTHRWMGPYCVAKAGVDMMVKVCADEMGAAGIRVNAVAPGIIATDLVAMVTPDSEVGQSYLRESPLSRFGEVSDVAPVVRFLAGPESGHITGTVVPVDGGHHLRGGPDYGEFARMLYGAAVDGDLSGSAVAS
jgi:NAD(P)-dependent dehydrogenase (short-subunit alcohol dehydrogenase family)